MEQDLETLASIDKRLLMLETHLGRVAWALEALARQGDNAFKTQEQQRREQARRKVSASDPVTLTANT